jgi:hypothetical protein
MKSQFLRTLGLLLLIGAFSLAGPQSLVGPQTAHGQFSVAGGLNFSQLSGIESNAAGTFENATGWHVGVAYELGLGPLALEPGIYYNQSGSFDLGNVPSNVPNSFDVTLVEVPVDAELRFLPTPIITPYVLAGPVFRFAQAQDDYFDDAVQGLTVAGNVGLGAKVSIPIVGIAVKPEFRYGFDLSNVARFGDFEDPDNALPEGVTTNAPLNAFMLRVNVQF